MQMEQTEHGNKYIYNHDVYTLNNDENIQH